jgi:hypothetical protein
VCVAITSSEYEVDIWACSCNRVARHINREAETEAEISFQEHIFSFLRLWLYICDFVVVV